MKQLTPKYVYLFTFLLESSLPSHSRQGQNKSGYMMYKLIQKLNLLASYITSYMSRRFKVKRVKAKTVLLYHGSRIPTFLLLPTQS